MVNRRGPRDGLKARWVDVVYRDREITDGCRVLLLLLAETMTDRGYVSVPRDRLADALDISPRRVTHRVSEAVEAGLLARRGGGYSGRTAEYEALKKVVPRGPALQT